MINMDIWENILDGVQSLGVNQVYLLIALLLLALFGQIPSISAMLLIEAFTNFFSFSFALILNYRYES